MISLIENVILLIRLIFQNKIVLCVKNLILPRAIEKFSSCTTLLKVLKEALQTSIDRLSKAFCTTYKANN